MSSTDESNKLQMLLAQWAQSETPSQSALDGLTQRVQSALRAQAAERIAGVTAPMHASFLQARSAPFLPLIAAIAAGLLISFGLWRINLQSPINHVPQKTFQLDASFDRERTAKSKLYAEMQRMFEDRIGWIAETDTNMWFDFESSPSKPSGQLLAVRLEICEPANQITHTDAKRVWIMDVILKNEQVALVQRGGLTPEVVIWPYLMEDGMVALDTTVTFLGNLPRQGQMTTVFSLNETGSAQKSTLIGEYEFRQSILILEPPTI